jgi:hypothetical protein
MVDLSRHFSGLPGKPSTAAGLADFWNRKASADSTTATTKVPLVALNNGICPSCMQPGEDFKTILKLWAEFQSR